MWADERTEPLFLDLARLTDQQHHEVAALRLYLPATPGSVVRNLLQIRQALLGTSKRYGSLTERSRDLIAILPLQLNFQVQVRAEAGGEREPYPELRQRTLRLWATLLGELSLRWPARPPPCGESRPPCPSSAPPPCCWSPRTPRTNGCGSTRR
ncbi:hypothetical protein GCM10022625_13760 [Deinococcus aetherius]